MSLDTRAVEYTHGDKAFEGVLAFDSGREGKRPAVLVFHGWEGRSEAQLDFAKKLTDWGYAGFACDLYGKGLRGTTPDECRALMTPLVADRATLRDRILKTVETVRSLSEVDATRVAAIGFCFGGLCVLDLARTGADVRGVASFHGLLGRPDDLAETEIKAKVMVFHGWDDPMALPEDVVALGRELTRCKADWQVHAYGGTMHAFMAPFANDPASGILYSEKASRRAWTSLAPFLAEVFFS
ncbi:dienelactone hydrolase family protein [Cystobacter fuscus DSM 2262]|uniref:Dienelactone hydrolase family protein n=1 Tax=Cystobacter fuscus (strain ATCC 25194 / DSM 2262 / NBRC 100088 / M29) TaxID=1242864 RepID=S9QII1_CYSF2|nr:dienelactone hydrolase family protein [Cystobacter fuscus]EPX56278.1 dienelactone hydrolase family protein [Cystobacter fuscus DSM 2262]